MDPNKYLKSLYRIIDLVISLMNLDKQKEEELRKEILATYYRRVYTRLITKSDTDEVKKINEIFKNDNNPQAVNTKLQELLSKLDQTEVLDVSLDELENIMKEMVHSVNATINDKSKIIFNQQVVSIFNSAN